MDIVRLIDLSFLSSKEQAIIQEVLKRDAKLRRREEQRIREMRRKPLDYRSMKLQSGEWFEDLKAKRFLEYPSATNLLQNVFQKEAKPEPVESRTTSCLSKIKSLTFLKMMFTDSTSTADLAKSFTNTKNFAVKEESSTSPSADEQLSITHILKDLELILDLELKNSSSNAEIVDINGFSPENAMVDRKLPADYSLHQVWHYQASANMVTSKNENTQSKSDSSGSAIQPGILNLRTFQTDLSPINDAKLGSGKGLPVNEYNSSKAIITEDVQVDNKQIYQHTGISSLPASARLLGEPLCSSPCLSTQFLLPGDEHAAEYIDTSCSRNCQLDPKELEKLSCETTLETESTIELPTIVAENSFTFMEDHVPLIDATSQDHKL